MPHVIHVIVKMYTGRSEEMKRNLVDEITKAIVKSLGVNESSISVALEEIEPDKWSETVYKPDILGKENLLYKEPGYTPDM